MAREFAKVRLSIWDDDDFRDITPAEQHLYFVLLTSYELTYCGVGDWRPARIAGHAKGWAAEQVVATAAGLIEKLYLVVDDATEEVLVRSFIRHDEILKQPKMAIAMARAHAKVASSTLRGVIVHELNRLHAEEPDLKGWSEKAVLDLLPKSSVDPSTYPLGWDAAFRNWLGNNVKWDQPRTPWAAGPVVDGFQLPPAPKEIIDNPDATAYVRWARAQRDEWLAAQNGSPA
jgi:hypothetical protein